MPLDLEWVLAEAAAVLTKEPDIHRILLRRLPISSVDDTEQRLKTTVGSPALVVNELRGRVF
jgi:hypothetical protein